jgi:hypothetical protein
MGVCLLDRLLFLRCFQLLLFKLRVCMRKNYVSAFVMDWLAGQRVVLTGCRVLLWCVKVYFCGC